MTEKDKPEKEVKSTYSTKGRKYTVQHVITVQIKVLLLHALSTMLLTFNTVMKVCVSASCHLSSHGGSSASQRRRKAGTPLPPHLWLQRLWKPVMCNVGSACSPPDVQFTPQSLNERPLPEHLFIKVLKLYLYLQKIRRTFLYRMVRRCHIRDLCCNLSKRNGKS